MSCKKYIKEYIRKFEEKYGFIRVASISTPTCLYPTLNYLKTDTSLLLDYIMLKYFNL